MMFWIVARPTGSLVVSLTTLYVLLGVRRSTMRAERGGYERLEILREQKERLRFLREERHMLEEELEWRRTMMNSEERHLAINATSEANGHSKQPKSRAWLQRIIGR